MADFDFESLIVDIPDYPSPGVTFKDITPLLADPQGFQSVINRITEHFSGMGITKVVGAEARGFMVGAPIAYRLGAGFVPARKAGKLPRETLSQSYALEYGEDVLEVHADALTADDKVLIVDDLIATGGTVVAQIQLIEQFGAEVVGLGFLLELTFLHPQDAVSKVSDLEIFSLVKVDAE